MERRLRARRRRRLSARRPVDATRSHVMAAIRSRDTGPERFVRSLAHNLGYRFRPHRRDLPGTPDLAFPRLNAVVFVHGCFWHRHSCHAGGKQPRVNQKYWERKFARNKERDRENRQALKHLGWRVLIIWECQLRCPELIKKRLHTFLSAEK